MVATVKIIPFAVPDELVGARRAIVARAAPSSPSTPFRPVPVGLIQTVLPGLKESVLDKTVRITEARLARSGSRVVARAAHRRTSAAAVAAAIARCSRPVRHGRRLRRLGDVRFRRRHSRPRSARRAARSIRAGMPVDPGNLLVLGEVGGKPVIGAPGCARSPKENGFDWVLDRLIAGLDVTAGDIAGMGVGGLLMEIPSRPQPREAEPRAPGKGVYIVVLAAGRSSRMAGPNKLMALFGGTPLIRRVAERALASRAAGTVVVTGHQADRVAAALAGLDVDARRTIPTSPTGLSSSLKAGIAALPAGRDGRAGRARRHARRSRRPTSTA